MVRRTRSSADADKPALRVSQIVPYIRLKKCCDLKTGYRGHSRSSKMVPFDRVYATSYSCSVVTMALSRAVSEIFESSKLSSRIDFSVPHLEEKTPLSNILDGNYVHLPAG